MKNILLILLLPLSIAATAQTKKVVVIGTRGGGGSTDTSFLRRDINTNTSQTIANAAAIQQRYDSLRRLPGSVQVQGLKSGIWYNAFIDSVGVGGGGGGTTYTGTAPVVVTGSVISVDTTKAQGKLATFNDVDIAKRWGLSGADIVNLNSGDVGIGTLPRYAGYFDVNKNFNVQGASAGNYMRYLPSLGKLIMISNTAEPIINLAKDNTGTNDFLSMNDNTSGGYINFGSNGSSFLPIIKMSAGSSSNDFAGFTINTRDVSTTAAFIIDARKAGGPLTSQPLMAVNSYGNERFTVLANGNLKIPILSTSLTAPLTTGTTRMAIVDQFGMFSSLPLPTGQLTSYTVATLPTGTIGMTAYVTDATAPTYLGSLTGGGTIKCPVFFNGTIWVSH